MTLQYFFSLPHVLKLSCRLRKGRVNLSGVTPLKEKPGRLEDFVPPLGGLARSAHFVCAPLAGSGSVRGIGGLEISRSSNFPLETK